MTQLTVRKKQEVYYLYNTTELPEKEPFDLNYGDMAYIPATDEAWEWDGTQWVKL